MNAKAFVRFYDTELFSVCTTQYSWGVNSYLQAHGIAYEGLLFSAWVALLADTPMFVECRCDPLCRLRQD